ncbi:helix-turn-helix domain-containing protein [Bacteroides sp.]|uniref:helix-turn-helix transcriptional regulator n=1 Tax=Bacteroides sp. TaxID=29523 RepID=UPI002602869F|nr:helix-turn-helix domain-containing protein [Bacteroides sp.]
MNSNKYPLRIDHRTVIYVTKDKCNPEYAEKKRMQFNPAPVMEHRGSNFRVSIDVEELRTFVQSGMHLKEIAKKMGVSKTTVEKYIKKYDLRNEKKE